MPNEYAQSWKQLTSLKERPIRQGICPNCNFVGKVCEESLVDRDGNAETEYCCSWCEYALTAKDMPRIITALDIMNAGDIKCKVCCKENIKEEWGDFCSSECLQIFKF